jgi:hypothetical protein
LCLKAQDIEIELRSSKSGSKTDFNFAGGIFMKWILYLSLIFSDPVAFAQVNERGERPDNEEYLAHSRLLILRIVPGDKVAKLYVAGNETAKIDLNKEHRILEITAVSSRNKREVLDFRKDGQTYIITKLPEWQEPYDIAVKSETRGDIGEAKIRIKNNKQQ